jgi:hypothetical protein
MAPLVYHRVAILAVPNQGAVQWPPPLVLDETLTMALPAIELLEVSITVSVWVPAVFKVMLKVWIPLLLLLKVKSEGRPALAAESEKWILPR